MVLAPLPAEQWDDTVRAALAGLLPRSRQTPEQAGKALSTLMHHPDLAKAYLTFNIHVLFRSTLPGRLRELAVLRVAARRACAYESAHHVPMAAAEGLTPAEIEAAGRGEAVHESDVLVLRAVDELETGSSISPDTWTALGAHLDERQRMDLIFTVGAYAVLAMAFNTFGVEPD